MRALGRGKANLVLHRHCERIVVLPVKQAVPAELEWNRKIARKTVVCAKRGRIFYLMTECTTDSFIGGVEQRIVRMQ